MKNQFLIFLAIGFLAACKTDDAANLDENKIRIKGSDTEFEMVKELAEVFSERSTMEFTIGGEGSGVGIEGLINGTVDVANSSREIYYEELEAAKASGVNPVPAVIAIDAIAIISNPHNHVDSLSTLELQQIFVGEIDNWSQLGGLDRPIRFYGRNSNSGTYGFLEERFVRHDGFTYKIQELENNQDILEAVMADTFALGYVGTGFIMDETGRPNGDIWAMYLYVEGDDAAYSPYETHAVIDGSYPLVRPLYQYFNGVPAGIISEFLQFELSHDGQEIIRKFGFFPITSEYESLNRQNKVVF